jgi:protein-S-isoprenylcysteine O-methyltransferase Ste14
MINRNNIILAVALVALVVYGALFAQPAHPKFPWHDLPGHMGLIGLGGCLLMVLFAKLLLSRLIQRPEDHDER